MSSRIDLGRDGEARAGAFLQELGYQILARNWRRREGELDLVVRRGEQLVFVEVKARRGAFAAESVTLAKQKRIRRLAALYLAEHPHRGEIRFDVVTVEASGVTHLEGAF